MTKAEFILDLPLKSLNHAYGNSIIGRKMTKAHKVWQDQMCWELKLLKQPKIKGPYSVAVEVPCATRSDIDNLLKGVLDCLVMIQATPDDSKLQAVSIKRTDRKNTLIVVED